MEGNSLSANESGPKVTAWVWVTLCDSPPTCVVTVVFPFNFDFAFTLWEQSDGWSPSPSLKDAVLQLRNI